MNHLAPVVLLSVLALTGAGTLPAAPPHTPSASLREPPVSPIPARIEHDPEKASLGEALFHDARLARDGRMSCAYCHHFDKDGADGLALSPRNDGSPGQYNTPTLFNAALNPLQTWTGRHATLEGQTAGAAFNPKHFGREWPELKEVIESLSTYALRFKALYPQGLTQDSFVDALSEYQRTLLTPDSPFDRWLRGASDAISLEAEQGWHLFRRYGCTSCHQGVNLGGNLLASLGLFATVQTLQNRFPREADQGRITVTGRGQDQWVYRVPPLRNVAVTGPWFHDGSVTTLKEAVELMGRYQLGHELDARDTARLVSFLESLTGIWRGEPLRPHAAAIPPAERQP
jgi:cytochrome c peroxidase